ncbi:MAG: hypothetical protein J6T74_06955, partial [Clostridia bacterium]|nr:hypothetical protein [Clostridia bacterium]
MSEIEKTDSGLSNLFVQYNKIKAEYSDSVLFFRLGDFYELFY